VVCDVSEAQGLNPAPLSLGEGEGGDVVMSSIPLADHDHGAGMVEPEVVVVYKVGGEVELEGGAVVLPQFHFLQAQNITCFEKFVNVSNFALSPTLPLYPLCVQRDRVDVEGGYAGVGDEGCVELPLPPFVVDARHC
jgi:hypothetical protein